MADLPGKDTIEALEARVGKGPMRALLCLLVLALAVGALGIVLGGLRNAFGALRPFLPNTGWTDWAFRIAVVLLFVGGFFEVFRRVRQLETVAADRRQWDRLEERVDYMENKVGGKLQDVLVEQMLEQGLPVLQPATHAERQRLEIVRLLLRDAAQAARAVEAAGGDLDKASNQAWLYMRILNLIAETLSFERYKEFRDHEEGLRRKREQHSEKADGRRHLVEMGDYLLQIADRLNFEDIDAKAKLPLSFGEYLRRE